MKFAFIFLSSLFFSQELTLNGLQNEEFYKLRKVNSIQNIDKEIDKVDISKYKNQIFTIETLPKPVRIKLTKEELPDTSYIEKPLDEVPWNSREFNKRFVERGKKELAKNPYYFRNVDYLLKNSKNELFYLNPDIIDSLVVEQTNQFFQKQGFILSIINDEKYIERKAYFVKSTYLIKTNFLKDKNYFKKLDLDYQNYLLSYQLLVKYESHLSEYVRQYHIFGNRISKNIYTEWLVLTKQCNELLRTIIKFNQTKEYLLIEEKFKKPDIAEVVYILNLSNNLLLL